MTPLRIIFAGSGEFGLPTLRALIDAGHEIVQVVTQPDRPAGRGRAVTATAIGEVASSRNLPLIKTANINAEQFPSADLMIVIAFGQKIGQAVVHHARLGSVNLHASILPKYRGAAPINWAIIRGESVAGNSVIRLAQRMDAGAVLAQSSRQIGELETAGELHDRLSADGAPLVLQVVRDLADGRAVETPQDEARATLAPKLSRESTRIDWSRPPVEIANQIRGMYPWPGCRVRLTDRDGGEIARVTLVRACAKSAQGGDGTIGADLNVGGVEIVELQPEGKRPMSLTAFRNGHRWEPGTKLQAI